jgi:hypothetical protein
MNKNERKPKKEEKRKKQKRKKKKAKSKKKEKKEKKKKGNMLVGRGQQTESAIQQFSVARGAVVVVARLPALASLVSVEITLTTPREARMLVGVRDASRLAVQPSAQVLLRDAVLSPNSPTVRIVAPPFVAAAFGIERAVVVVSDTACALSVRVVTARGAEITDAHFADVRAELRLYRNGLRARTVQPYGAYTARLVDVSDPSATMPVPVLTTGGAVASAFVELDRVHTAEAPQTQTPLTLSSARAGDVPPCSATFAFVPAVARLVPRAVGDITEFALEFGGTASGTVSGTSAGTAGGTSAGASGSVVPTLLVGTDEVACTTVAPGVFAARLPMGEEIRIARIVADGESQYFELAAPMVLAAPAVATSAEIVDAADVAREAYARVRLVLRAADASTIVPTTVPALVSVTSIDGTVSDASATVVSGEIVVALIEPTRVFSVHIGAGTVCASGATCAALVATLPLSYGETFVLCTCAGASRVFGAATAATSAIQRVSYAARRTFDAHASSVAVDASGSSVSVSSLSSLSFDAGFSGSATTLVLTSDVATSGRKRVGTAQLALGAGLGGVSVSVPVYADVLGTGVAILDASNVTATYADSTSGRSTGGRADSLRASTLRSLFVRAAQGVSCRSGSMRVSGATPSATASATPTTNFVDGGVECTFPTGLSLAPGVTYKLELRDAVVDVGDERVLGVNADVAFGAPTIALVAHGSAATNMGLPSEPSTRVVPFDASDARFSAPPQQTLRTVYVRAQIAGAAAGAAVGFVGASAVGVSTDSGATFVPCAAFDSLGVGAQQNLILGLGGPYFRRVPCIVGGATSHALLGVFVGTAVDTARVKVAVDGLVLDSGLGSDARLVSVSAA